MKLITRLSKKSLIVYATICALALGIFAGVQYSSALTDEEYKAYSDADIYFYSGDCVGGYSSSVCGNTAEEKVWSILRQTLDPIHAAAAFGSIAHEGGFQPVKWEYGKVVDTSTCSFLVSWNDLYNGVYDGRYGVGSFGLTSGLSTYLHHVNDTAPDLLKYFKDPTNTCLSTGDELAEKIGESEYDRLIDIEVNYFINQWIGEDRLEAFKNTTSLEDAATYWAHDIERCAACGYDGGSSQIPIRVSSAQKYYEQYKDFTCSSSSSKSSSSSPSTPATSTVSGKDIIWIGDSDSAFAGEKLLDNTFPGLKESGGWGPSFNDSESYIQSCKFINSVGCGDSQPNRSGLDILEQIIKQDNLRPYLVFALGGNGGWDEASMNKFLKLIEGKDVQVVITTAKYRTVDYPEGNELARKVAEEHPNIYLADIAANYSDGYFDEDDIEFNAEGSQMFVRTIKEALEEASGNGGCTTFTGDYPDYSQCDPRWANLPYSNGTFCDSACGATSMAMIATKATGQEVLPTDVANLLGSLDYPSNPGTAMEPLNKKVCEKYGCEVEMVPYTPGEAGLVDKLRKSLEDGWMILTSGGCNDGGGQNGHGPTCPFSAGGHYVAIFGLKDKDTAIVGDPGWDGLTEYKLTDIAAGLKASAYSIIRGSGSKGSSCANYCKDTGGGAVNGGLTKSQAQKLVDYYNSDAVDGSNLPFGKMNCVSFVKWFIEEFTDLTYDGGNGKDVAHNLATANNLEEGNEPRPFSVFSVTTIGTTMCGSFKCGHTGIVVAVDGDMITTAEAAFEHYNGTVFTANKTDFSNAEYGKTYTYIDSAIDKEKLSKIIGK